MLPPGSTAAIVQLLGLTFALFNVFKRCNTKIRLQDDNVPSQKELEAEKLARELDGIPVNPEEYQHGIRLRRTLLVITAALALSLNIAQIAYTAAYNSSNIRITLQSTWPVLCDSLIWVSILLLSSKHKTNDFPSFSYYTLLSVQWPESTFGFQSSPAHIS